MKKYALSCLLTFAVLLSGCSQRSRQIEPEPILLEENSCTFEDGTPISFWKMSEYSDSFFYQSEDGTRLLEFTCPPSPESTCTGLEPEAMQAVTDYYGMQGLLYDVEALLEDACTDYALCQQEQASFRTHIAMQDTWPSAETERFIAICTTVTEPAALRYDGTATEHRYSCLFDRTTGELMSVWDVFQVPEAEARTRLIELCENQGDFGLSDNPALLDSASFIWFSDVLEIWFQPGTLHEEAPLSGVGFNYEELKDILQPWAIPVSSSALTD